MWKIILIITTVICATGWISNKIGLLTILLFLAERGIDIPDAEERREYSEKVIKKILKIKD